VTQHPAIYEQVTDDESRRNTSYRSLTHAACFSHIRYIMVSTHVYYIRELRP